MKSTPEWPRSRGSMIDGVGDQVGRTLRHAITAYRRYVSPLPGTHCRFYPSCSEYARTAIARHGASRGGLLAVQRLLRCHPFHPGGVDLVPEAPPKGERRASHGQPEASEPR